MAAVIGDSVYMVIRTTENGNNTMYIYNIRTGTWTSGSRPADTLNYYGAICAYGGKLYQLGGWTNRKTYQIYTPGSGWVLSVSPLGNVGGRTPCLVGMKDYIFAYGGANGTVAWADVARFDTAGLTWTAETPMPEARLGAFFGAVDSANIWGIHYACGNYDPGSSSHYRGYWVSSGIHWSSFDRTTNFNLTIAPNPAKSYLVIRSPLSADRPAIKIYDASGKFIKVAEKVTSAQEHKKEIRISLKGINPEIYFLKYGTETKKFLVVK